MAKHICHCQDCGRKKTHKTPHGFGGTGYGILPGGKKVCYECCAVRDKAEMIETGKAVLYLAGSMEAGYRVTNWPGTLSILVKFHKRGRHNIAEIRNDVWFVGPDKSWWWGVQYGYNTQICHCRRIKNV